MHAQRLLLLSLLVLAPPLLAVGRADDRTPKGDKEQTEPTAPVKTPPAALAALHFKVRTGIDVAEDPRGLVVKHVREESDAAESGIKEGDLLLRVNDHAVHSGEELQQYLDNHATDPAYMVTVRRGTRQFEAPLGRKTTLMGMLIFADRTDRPTVRQVDAGSAAEEAGLKPGDLIGGVGGHRIENFKQFLDYTIPLVQRTPSGQPIPFNVLRGGHEVQLAVSRPENPGLPLLPPPSTPHSRPPVSLGRVPAPPRPMRERRTVYRRNNRTTPEQQLSHEDFLRGLSGLPPINANIQQNNAPQNNAPQNVAPQTPGPPNAVPQPNTPPTTNGSQNERRSKALLAGAPAGFGLMFPTAHLAALLAAADPVGASTAASGQFSGIMLAQAGINSTTTPRTTPGTGTVNPTIPNPITGNTGTPQGVNPITGNMGTATGTNAGFVNNAAANRAANQNNAAGNAARNGGLGNGWNMDLGSLNGFQGVTAVVATLHASQVVGNTTVNSNTTTGTNTRSRTVNRNHENLLTPGTGNESGTNDTNAAINGTSGTANAIQPGQIVGFVIVMSNPSTNAQSGIGNGTTGTTGTGIAGTTGAGTTGSGTAGLSGTNGISGGLNGSAGVNGTAGINATGTNGTAGTNGTTGQTIITARIAGLAPGTYVLAVNQFGDCGDVINGSAGGVAGILGTINITATGQGSFTSVANVNPQSLLGRVVSLSPGAGSSGQLAGFPSQATRSATNQAGANQTNPNQLNANTGAAGTSIVQACGVFGLGNPARSVSGFGNGFGTNGVGDDEAGNNGVGNNGVGTNGVGNNGVGNNRRLTPNSGAGNGR